MARVNAYLYLLSNGKPENAKYITDYDLLPADHPKSTRKNATLTNITEVKLVDKNLQEQIEATLEDTIVEEATSAETKESVADVSIDMKWDEDGNKVMAEDDPMEEEMPDDVVEDEEDMMGHPDEDEKDMMEDPEKDDEDMAEHGDDEDKMAYPKDDEEKMAKDEQPMEEMGYDKDKEKMSSATVATETEDDDNAEEAKEDSDASFTESERAELERFRKEEKEKILASYQEFLTEEVYVTFKEGLDSYTKDVLETELKLKVADYFLAKAKEEAKADEAKAEQTGFKTLQVISQLKESRANDLAKLVEKYKK
jgi:hypothetical protein